MSTRTIARAMTTGRGRSVWAIEAVPAEMTCRVFTSPAWGMNTRPCLCGRRVERPQLLLDELPLLRVLSMHPSMLSGMVSGRCGRRLGRRRSSRLARRRRWLRDRRRVRGRRLGQGGSTDQQRKRHNPYSQSNLHCRRHNPYSQSSPHRKSTVHDTPPRPGLLGPTPHREETAVATAGFVTWAILDSNQGPPPYQSGALTN